MTVEHTQRGWYAGDGRLGMATPDILDRLMELWQQPWSEPAFGEAQMLLGKLREAIHEHAWERCASCDNGHKVCQSHPIPQPHR